MEFTGGVGVDADTGRVRGISPEACGRMAEHFCQALSGLAEGLDDRQK